ncbi:MAG: hypothetical protein ACRESJ_17970 [Pseudomonas sp.]|uniref:hypothetical protein n=1 Tax=Pseudomonas sp. TaxID=306 RepID=UPI003D6DE147
MSSRSIAEMLRFDPAFASLRDGLSVAQQIGNTLWVANDEITNLERLAIQDTAPGNVVMCDEYESRERYEYSPGGCP